MGKGMPQERSRVTARGLRPISNHCLVIARTLAFQRLCWDSAIDWNVPMTWNDAKPEPLFKRLDLDEILASEQSLADTTESAEQPGHTVKGGKKNNKSKEDKEMTDAPEGTTYLNFETFMEVDLRVGKIQCVDDHPNADRLFVVSIDDGSGDGRTI